MTEWKAVKKTGTELPADYQFFKCVRCGHKIASTEKPEIDCWECDVNPSLEPEADGVIYRYENSVSDRWRYSQEPDYGKELSAERELVYTSETIIKVLKYFINDRNPELSKIDNEVVNTLETIIDLFN